MHYDTLLRQKNGFVPLSKNTVFYLFTFQRRFAFSMHMLFYSIISTIVMLCSLHLSNRADHEQNCRDNVFIVYINIEFISISIEPFTNVYACI